MVSIVMTATLRGLEVDFVEVEADVGNGLPGMHLIGYLSSEVKEAAERVRAAIKNTGIQIPPKKIVVNLSPAHVRKTGGSFDLPIAVAVLLSLGEIKTEQLCDVLFLGELGLDGKVRRITGVLPMIIEARKAGYQTCILPRENEREASIAKGIQIIGVESLTELVVYLRGQGYPRRGEDPESIADESGDGKEKLDYGDVQGQSGAKRAVEIAVAGHHNLLFVGPPGAGKTMIASRIPSILPPLTEEEILEISKVYSVSGLLDDTLPYISTRPFRSVHHTVSRAAFVGGGSVPRPGEISLASGGVLFLDELAEFPKELLETLRQPLEEHIIRIARARGTCSFPAEFFLVAAMNPCPCGNYPDLNTCTCTRSQMQQYRNKISQPFIDRMDMCVEVPKVEYQQLKGHRDEETSAGIRERVLRAMEIQKKRFAEEDIRHNSQISSIQMDTYCFLQKEEEAMMKQAFAKMNLTARTYHKVLRVARTIADLDGADRIQTTHLAEALGYRALDRSYWNQ